MHKQKENGEEKHSQAAIATFLSHWWRVDIVGSSFAPW